MTDNKLHMLEQEIHYHELDNGLKVYLLPDLNKKHYYASLCCRYGSNDRTFIPINQEDEITLPEGTAHFLEHKLFEMPDGTDPFSFFMQTGTGVNAGTSYYTTKFYIWGSKNLPDNLTYLFEMVFNPHFTERNIVREIGIIAEEIKMYDDDPAWILDNTMRYNLFNEWAIKDKIAGTVDSIGEITQELLYDTYRTFYQPDNMFLIIGGAFNYQEVEHLLNNYALFKQIPHHLPIKRIIKEEKGTVRTPYQVIKANIIIPKFKYSFKIDKNHFSLKDPIKINMYLNCIFAELFSNTSDFYEKSRYNNLTTGYYFDHSYHGHYYIFNIEAESDNASDLKELIDKTLANIVITDKEFERHKKMWLSSEIRLNDHIDVLVDSIADDLIIYNHVYFDRISVIKSLNKQELDQIIKELDLSNNALVLMVPRNNI